MTYTVYRQYRNEVPNGVEIVFAKLGTIEALDAEWALLNARLRWPLVPHGLLAVS